MFPHPSPFLQLFVLVAPPVVGAPVAAPAVAPVAAPAAAPAGADAVAFLKLQLLQRLQLTLVLALGYG